ncbi:MAG: hypothetical protein M1826_007195 [Phylliscum demangeonii]|nr:MAG: hypothetical protein M1826_007195 [Phylliscum demangeonii]
MLPLHPAIVLLLLPIFTSATERWTPVVVKDVVLLDAQRSPNITHVSRDGGHSVLLDGQIVWLYDDTECISADGTQLSFLSNTASYASQLQTSLSIVTDFGVTVVGKNRAGGNESAILNEATVGSGGWIPFATLEAEFNEKNKGSKRIAIWPGTAPTPVNRTHAYLHAPVVYVDSKPQDAAPMYVSRGITLLWMTAGTDGPSTFRTRGLLFPDGHVPFGSFASVVGSASRDRASPRSPDARDVYVFGVADGGLQLARVALDKINNLSAYTYFNPATGAFTAKSPDMHTSEPQAIYLPGTFSSGDVFFSPYFRTFLFIYFNKLADSTFYLRFLDLQQPLHPNGDSDGDRDGIGPNDVDAVARYAWSDAQILYRTTPGAGGFNYAGATHPEYFNRQYYPTTAHFDDPFGNGPGNDWYGGGQVSESDWEFDGDANNDGRHLLLSWTAQVRAASGGDAAVLYEIQLAHIAFDDIPARAVVAPDVSSATAAVFSLPANSTATATTTTATITATATTNTTTTTAPPVSHPSRSAPAPAPAPLASTPHSGGARAGGRAVVIGVGADCRPGWARGRRCASAWVWRRTWVWVWSWTWSLWLVALVAALGAGL